MSAHGADAMVFPSVEWFEGLQQLVNNDPEFRRIGSIDAVMGVKVGEKVFILTFEAFECSEVKEGTDYDLIDADFFLEMSVEDWQDLITNTKENGARGPYPHSEHPGPDVRRRDIEERHRRPVAGRHLLPRQPELAALLRQFRQAGDGLRSRRLAG